MCTVQTKATVVGESRNCSPSLIYCSTPRQHQNRLLILQLPHRLVHRILCFGFGYSYGRRIRAGIARAIYTRVFVPAEGIIEDSATLIRFGHDVAPSVTTSAKGSNARRTPSEQKLTIQAFAHPKDKSEPGHIPRMPKETKATKKKVQSRKTRGNEQKKKSRTRKNEVRQRTHESHWGSHFPPSNCMTSVFCPCLQQLA